MADVIVNFEPKGDDEVLDAIKKVTKHVGDLKRIAKTPIDLEIVRKSMSTEDFNRLKSTIDRAKEATRDYGKEAAKAARDQERLAAAAERAAQRAQAAAEKAAQREQAASERSTAKAERDAQRKAAAAERAAARAAAAYERAAAREARTSPVMGGITGSMSGGGGRGGGPLPLGNAFSTGPDPRAFSPKAVDELNRSLGETGKRAQKAAEGLGFVGRIIAAMAIRSFVREVYDMANAWTAFENKIKTVLDSQEDLAFVTKDLIGISQRARMSLEAVGSIYTRTSRAVAALGKSQIETAKFTETLSKAVAVGGATSIEAKNAMIQLSQGLSSGTLKGDELRSVLEQLPIVAQLIAEKMGVTTGALRKLGSEGKLTTDVVFSAILDATPKIEAQFAKMKPTMESVVQVIKDKFMVAIGQSSGAIDLVTKALQLLSDNFDVAFKAATALAGAMAVLGAGKILSMILAIGTGWGGVVAAIVAATTAYAAFADKINASEDGLLKVSNVQHAWFETMSKDFKELKTLLEDSASSLGKFLGLFSADVKFSHSWDLMYERLAKITDFFRVMVNPEVIVGGLLGDKDALEYAGRTQRNLKRERALAEGAQKDAFWTKQQETEQRFNAMMRGYMPNTAAASTPPKKEGAKEHGKTFEELIKEAMFDERNSLWSETEQKIRDRLHNMMEKLKPSIKAALDDIGAQKQIAAMEREFKREHTKEKYLLDPERIEEDRKKLDQQIAAVRARNAELLRERDVLEDIVRQEATREFYAKQREEHEKEMEAYLDERLKQMKEMEEIEKKNRDKRSDKAVARHKGMEGIASSLNPNVAIAERIGELQKFEEFARKNNLAEWARLANEEIQSLQMTMLFGMDPLKEYGAQMQSIFGPGGVLVQGFADAAANAIVMSQSLNDLRKALVDVLNNVQKQAISSLIQIPLNLATGALTNSLSGGMTSSLGGGARAVSASEAASWNLGGTPGFASGGYTGNMGTSQVAGVVHGQEFVLNAEATRRMGRQNLEMINKGATSVSPAAAPVQVTVNNMAGAQVETNQLSPGQVEIMITRAINERTGKLVAGQINDPNSPVSRSLQKNVSSDRRRI